MRSRGSGADRGFDVGCAEVVTGKKDISQRPLERRLEVVATRPRVW